MKRVLITGANGFIGRHTLDNLLDRGFEVHALCWPETGEASDFIPDGIEVHFTDLLVPGNAAKIIKKCSPTHVLHLAWYTEHGKYWQSSINLDWVRASIELSQAFNASGGQRFVCAGTCAEYTWTDQERFSESSERNPSSLYGKCKTALFDILFSNAFLNNLSFAWGRVFFIYGPGEHPDKLVSGLIRKAISGEKGSCTFGSLIRDHIYVEDVANAFCALLDSPVEGPVNIGTGMAMSLETIAGTIAHITQTDDLITAKNEEPPPDQPARIVASTERLTNEVGYSLQFSLEEGLKKTLQWWQDEMHNINLK